MMNHNRSSRRAFLGAATTLAAARVASARDEEIPIIDTHLHLYDPTRPQGVPYPPGPNPPQALPQQYREDVTRSESRAASKSKPAPGSKTISGCWRRSRTHRSLSA